MNQTSDGVQFAEVGRALLPDKRRPGVAVLHPGLRNCTTTQSRRTFLKTSCAIVTGSSLVARAVADDTKKSESQSPLAGEVGIVSASCHAQFMGRSKNGKFSLLELPRLLRDEVGIRVIDLNTTSFAAVDKTYLDRLRDASDKAGCVMTNLKMNQRGIDMNSPDRQTREKALAEYKRSIDVAAHLGLNWARPLPRPEKPDMAIHVASYRELCDYGAERNVQLLVENFGWMQSDPDSVVNLVKAIGHNVAACPDTGNWASNEIRYSGLAKTFPLAVTCDYKARTLGPDGGHEQYDLKRCFTIGWKAGFRGPWCLEHGNQDTKQMLRELVMLREMIQRWTAELQED